jgi:anti-anti-sigma factor
MPLELTTTPLKTFGSVIKLMGSLDTNTFGQLETEIQGLVAAGAPLVVLDLAGLSYISSAGIRVVQKGTRAMEKAGGQFKLINPQPQVAKVFEIIRMLPVDQMFTSLEELDAYLDKAQSDPPAPGGS